jgi:dihydroxyacetone kinase-like predicted kinase
MEEAAAGVRTVEVTRATRAVTLNGIDVKAGDALGLLDDKLVVATADPLETAQQALTQAGAASAELITIYRGKGVPEDDGEALAAAIRARYGRAEVEVVDGGQPHYDYLISVE